MPPRIPLPFALFDTVEHISEQPSTQIIDYLNTLGIVEAHKELELTREFLISYAGSADTYTSYRREVERLLQWAWLIVKKPLKQLNRNDIRDYLAFIQKPPITWIATQNAPRFTHDEQGNKISNPLWRPFVARVSKAQRLHGIEADKKTYQLHNKSLQALFAGLSTFFTFLQQEEYLEANPMQLVRQKNRYLQKQQTLKVTRKLSPLQWSFVIDIAAQQAQGEPEQERALFMLSAFYLLGLRISELAETPGRHPKMGDFAPDKHNLWWFTTVGKGNKVRDVAVPDTLLAALKRYRISRGLTPLPGRSDDSPLLHSSRKRNGIGTRQIRNLIQNCFNQAEAALRQAGKLDEAEDLCAATVHWLRHTAISADIEFRPREHVRDDAGHENPATTERYIDTDRFERHASAQKKLLRPLKI
ncbi:tyrosine-type recombinase/integrase [soil metagenome]